MAEHTVNSVGFRVCLDTQGYYQVAVWSRLNAGRMQEIEYVGLTWQEVQETVEGELNGNRPGWAIGFGWMQPSLLDDGAGYNDSDDGRS